MITDLQAAGQPLGRIRTGDTVQAASGNMRPNKLPTFRFTAPSRYIAGAIADLYGGEVRPWRRQFEVYTGVNEIGVTVPPHTEVITQWYEMWSKGGCLRRCTSQVEQLTGGECLCPHAADPTDPDEVREAALRREELAKMNPPQACKRVTRINVMIPDLPDLGVFRLDTGSYYAAREVRAKAALLELARQRGVYLPAVLGIDERERIKAGKTTPYPVVFIRILNTMREISAGVLEGGGLAAQLPPPPQALKAIAAGRAALPAAGREAATPPATPPAAIRPSASMPPSTPPPAGRQAGSDRLADPQDIADRAQEATTPEEFRELAARARADGIESEQARGPDGVYDELIEILRDRWKVLAAGQQTAGGRPSQDASAPRGACCGDHTLVVCSADPPGQAQACCPDCPVYTPHPPLVAPGGVWEESACADCGALAVHEIHRPVPGGD